MSVRKQYDQIRAAVQLDEARATSIVAAARPHAEGLLRPSSQDGSRIQVTARRVLPGDARGGSLIPAWPIRQADGSVTIEFVEDWGVMLASWCAVPGLVPSDVTAMIELVQSGERVWVGIANDVLQMYVPDPPTGTYSMVRHHALMLGAATLWLGPERARRWQQAHAAVGRAFLGRQDAAGLSEGRSSGGKLWDAIEAAERGLTALLADPRGQVAAESALD